MLQVKWSADLGVFFLVILAENLNDSFRDLLKGFIRIRRFFATDTNALMRNRRSVGGPGNRVNSWSMGNRNKYIGHRTTFQLTNNNKIGEERSFLPAG